MSSTSIGVAQIQSYIESEADTTERQAIQTWLCPEDIQYESNFKEALELRQSKTGSWLFETMEYDRYIQDEGKCLWLYGIGRSSIETLFRFSLICYESWLWKDYSVVCMLWHQVDISLTLPVPQ